MTALRSLILLSCAWAVTTGAAPAAEELKLREGISFYQDIDAGFPIVGEKMEDVTPADGKPTFIFFGAAGDLNTHRQARRVVDLYRRYRTGEIKFVIIDVDQPGSTEARRLIQEYYKGFVPFQVLLDRQRRKIWSHIGEIESRQLSGQIDRAFKE